MINTTKKIAILASILTLLTISSCYKKMDCINRRVCVMYYKGANKFVNCSGFIEDTSIFSKVGLVVNEGYDYVFIYDSTFHYSVKSRPQNRDEYYSIYNQKCVSE